MGLIELEELLQPVSPAEPAGPNLEYAPAFLELERSASGKAEQQIGDLITPAEPPDYRAVFKQSKALFSQSKDLRIAVQMVRALVHTHGYEALPDGLTLVHRLLDRYWETVHPQLDPEDDNDPTMRMTALAGLGASDVMLALRTAPLVRSRSFGDIAIADLMAAATGETPEGSPQEHAHVRAALHEAGAEALSSMVVLLQNAAAELFGIESFFETKGLAAPDFSALSQHLRRALRTVVQHHQAQEKSAEAAAPAVATDVVQTPMPAPGKTRARTPGEVASREDVLRVLDSVCAYYARYEPSSPLPLLLARCKRLVSKSFMEILNDLAPAAVPDVELIAGKAAEE